MSASFTLNQNRGSREANLKLSGRISASIKQGPQNFYLSAGGVEDSGVELLSEISEFRLAFATWSGECS